MLELDSFTLFALKLLLHGRSQGYMRNIGQKCIDQSLTHLKVQCAMKDSDIELGAADIKPEDTVRVWFS